MVGDFDPIGYHLCVALRMVRLRSSPGRTSLGVRGNLGTDEWGIPRICSKPVSWRGLVVAPDNANTNKMLFRHLGAETESPRLLAVAIICLARNLPNATRWSFGKCDFSGISRLRNMSFTSQALKARRVPRLRIATCVACVDITPGRPMGQF